MVTFTQRLPALEGYYTNIPTPESSTWLIAMWAENDFDQLI
jgi:hypothetical protein